MITGKKEELDGTIKTHHCPEHPDKELTTAWHGVARSCPVGQEWKGIAITEDIVKAGGFYLIACGGGHYPEEVTPKTTLTQAYKQDALPEGPVKDHVKQGAERRRGGLPATVDGSPLGLMPSTDFGDGTNITIQELGRAVDYAERTDLDIRLGHVCLYYGRPYPTIDGYLYHARRSKRPYKLVTFPLTDAERIQYQVGPLDYAWKCKLYLLPNEGEFSGIGIVTDEERMEMSKNDPSKHRSPVVFNKPWQLSQKRAEWQALKRAFPLGEKESDGQKTATDGPVAP